MLVGSIIFGTLLLLSYIAFLYIRSSYREYDRIENLKENILKERARIKQVQDYLRSSYEPNVYSSLKISLDFCLKMIYNKSLEEQLVCLKSLYEVLYETTYRLKKDYVDVNYILAPLVNFRSRLFEDQMDYIKENAPEELT